MVAAVGREFPSTTVPTEPDDDANQGHGPSSERTRPTKRSGIVEVTTPNNYFEAIEAIVLAETILGLTPKDARRIGIYLEPEQKDLIEMAVSELRTNLGVIEPSVLKQTQGPLWRKLDGLKDKSLPTGNNLYTGLDDLLVRMLDQVPGPGLDLLKKFVIKT